MWNHFDNRYSISHAIEREVSAELAGKDSTIDHIVNRAVFPFPAAIIEVRLP